MTVVTLMDLLIAKLFICRGLWFDHLSVQPHSDPWQQHRWGVRRARTYYIISISEWESCTFKFERQLATAHIVYTLKVWSMCFSLFIVRGGGGGGDTRNEWGDLTNQVIAWASWMQLGQCVSAVGFCRRGKDNNTNCPTWMIEENTSQPQRV